jgi:hypothetical protein
MNILDLLTTPRYGIYRPGTGTVDFEYTSYRDSFRLSTSMELSAEASYRVVEDKLKAYLKSGKDYLDGNDLALLSVLLEGAADSASYVINFDEKGITLASLITVDARKINFIYEKYSDAEYALQLALTRSSSIKFAWSDKALKGDFYFNIKRSGDEDITTITGYTNFHLGNEAGAKPVTLSAGIVKRKPLVDPNKSTDAKEEVNNENKKLEKKLEKADHTYVRLQSRNVSGITVKDIVSMFTTAYTEIPDVLDNVSFYDFAILSRKSRESGKEINDFAIVIDCKITIKDTPLKAKLTIHTTKEVGKETQAQTFSFSALVTVDEHQFQLKFTTSEQKSDGNNKSAWSILATYANEGKVTLDIQKMITDIFGANDIPKMSLTLHQPKVFFYYQRSTIGGKAAEGNSTGKLLFGAGASIDIGIKDLPIVGSILVEMKALEFKELLFIYSSEAMSQDDLNPLAKSKMLDKSSKAIGKGLSLTAEIVIDGQAEHYTFGGKVDAVKKTDSTVIVVKDPAESKTKELSSSVSSDAKWYSIDKKLGPVNFQRLGLKYQDGRAYILLDASVNTAAMTLSMMGLGVGFKPDWDDLDPSFHLKGLGLSYKTDAVEISGAFLRGQQGGIETYSGAALIKMKSFTISAIGSYAQTDHGASLFIYGLFEGNIGGPPIFYVTGIAAGFGYNRKINAPDLDEIATYPLVALAMNQKDTGIASVLTSLETPMASGKLPIEISPGDYWLAVGVKFTSFKIIESFLLLTVNFGTKTEYNVLGLSRLSWPEESLRKKVGLKDPIIYVELAIKASFGPESDVIKIDGLITPNSYILSKDCRLTGGFAFYTWVSGEHAGDFVMSIGGYHPRFNKPAHYPVVPRVALNWKLSDNLLMRGELYFALTPSAIMMGGRWELLYTSSNVKAAFIMWIDILMQWAPFYYDISIGIILKIEAHISLKLITIHLNLELRAQLDIWGPPFSGRAEIDLGIYSFEIRFGNKELPRKEPLEWNAFADGFLPKEEKKEKNTQPRQSPRLRSKAPAANAPIPVDCITATVSAGVIDVIEEKDKEKLYIANPMQFQLAIDSAIPVTKLTLNGKDSTFTNDAVTQSKLGVKACGFNNGDVTFAMDVKILFGSEDVTSNFVTEKITKGFPAALWGSGQENNDNKPVESKILQGIMSGINISANLPEPSYLKPFDFSTFVEQYTHDNCKISCPELEAEENFNTYDVYKIMKYFENLDAPRMKMYDDLKTLDMGFDIMEEKEADSLNMIFSDGGSFFRGTPKLGKIGHIYHNPTDTTNT